MAKIPKNLSDRDMFKGYVEEDTLADTFLKAEKREDAKRAQHRAAEREDISTLALSPQIVKQLGKMLLELKMTLFQDGVRNYDIRVRRDGRKIVLEPVIRDKK